MKKSIYLAGPMTGIRNFNYPAFYRTADILRRRGWDVVNPAELGDAIGTPEDINSNPRMLATLMRIELHAIADCDAIALMTDWHKSVGAKKELELALKLNKEVILI